MTHARRVGVALARGGFADAGSGPDLRVRLVLPFPTSDDVVLSRAESREGSAHLVLLLARCHALAPGPSGHP
ncbi:MAG: hypothetical protein AAF628_22305 [Planctomycetota bacterium]